MTMQGFIVDFDALDRCRQVIQAEAAKFNSVITIPTFETTPEAVTKSADSALTEAETALRAAADTCPKSFTEYRAAVAELKRLKP